MLIFDLTFFPKSLTTAARLVFPVTFTWSPRFVRRTDRAGIAEGGVGARPAPAAAPSSERRSNSLLLGRM
ncbi:hypothetical protein [Saccharopolyspora shandongensis]|uniref:hypothetical protein n=1 Tax=Saccharopolyspora shandongensis TaxID=418495 RepID=UPI000B86805B|nr:hypothetical protein [Saccharopolyspora shandongensis]